MYCFYYLKAVNVKTTVFNVIRIIILYALFVLYGYFSFKSIVLQGSRWTFQGMLMNGRIDLLNWTLKPDQIHLINPLFVLISIPLFDAMVYPILYKIGINTPLRKIALGGIITALSFVSAAIVQYTIMVRKYSWRTIVV